MPISEENKARYPKDWADIRDRVRTRAGNKCEFCGVENWSIGGRTKAGVFHKARPLGEKLLRLEWPGEGTQAYCEGYDEPLRIIRIVLTCAHLDHQPENNDDDNLKALCQRCHLLYDSKHHAHNAAITRAEKRGQKSLFPLKRK